GYEYFDLKASAVSGHLNGEGWTLGGYAGWRLAADLTMDAGFTHSWLTYNARAGIAFGRFAGDRWLASGGLTGGFMWRSLEFEPSVRLYGLSEHEAAYTDSLGA